MIIKNLYIINNSEYFINNIIKELCENNISYLYIKDTNELHFNKYIIRFITKENFIDIKNQINYDDLLFKIFEIAKDNKTLLDNESYDTYDLNNLKEHKNYLLNIKLKNQNTNIKLKNINKNKVLKKQLNPTRRIYKR